MNYSVDWDGPGEREREMQTDGLYPEGPYIVWEDYGYEGWQPKSFASLKEAVEHHTYSATKIITKVVTYSVAEKE